MENLLKCVNIELVRGDEIDKQLHLVANPGYISHRIFNENLIGIDRVKTKLTLNRPIYVGLCVLDLSKLHMYDFWHKNLKKQYGEKIKLLYTDTDSLMIEVETEDIYKVMHEHKEDHDLSEYQENSQYYNKENKRVIGKFQDEYKEKIINEGIFIRSKMYSYKEISGKEMDKAESVSRTIIAKDLRHTLYKECIEKDEESRHKQICIRSHNHHMGVYKQNEKTLDPLGTKKWIAPNHIDTRVYRNYKIKLDEMNDAINNMLVELYFGN